MSKPVRSIKKIIRLLKNDLPRDHSNYIFFVTSKCNQACEFCFYRNRINRTADLSLVQIKSLSSKIGNISNILFSGGEPILRRDILEIIDIFVTNNHMKSLTVPSNGMSKDIICNLVYQILAKYPVLSLQVCISLDGDAQTHDKIRGVNGAYSKAIESIRALENFAKQHDKFSLNINTVISPGNIHTLCGFIQDVQLLGIEHYTHSFEIARPKSIREANFLFDTKELRAAYNLILEYKDGLYLRKLKCNNFEKWLLAALQYANIYTLYKIQFEFLIKNKKWPMRCCAGLDNNVIYNNGDLAICELREPFKNTKDISQHTAINDIFEGQKKKTKNCYCTHLCYILLSMYKSRKVLLVLMPLRVIRYLAVRMKLRNYF